MKLYKIFFENNRPVAANPLDSMQYQSVKIDDYNGKKCITWIVTFAKDAQDGINLANQVVRNIFPA